MPIESAQQSLTALKNTYKQFLFSLKIVSDGARITADKKSNSTSAEFPNNENGFKKLETRHGLDVWLEPEQLKELAEKCLTVTIYRPDGAATVLTESEVIDDKASKPSQMVCKPTNTSIPHAPEVTWHLPYDEAPIARLEITGISAPKKNCAYLFTGSKDETVRLLQDTCHAEYVLVRRGSKDKVSLHKGMEVRELSEIYDANKVKNRGITATLFAYSQNLTDFGLLTINGDDKIFERHETSFLPTSNGTWIIDWQETPADGCRAISPDDDTTKQGTILLQLPVAPQPQLANGIIVSPSKIYDVVTLQRMLNTTANQLSAISGFNSNSVSGAFGNFQGVTRDISYFNAQVTTAPTPSVSQSSALGVTTPNTTQTISPVGSTIVTLQCPDGSLPTIGSGTTLGGCGTISGMPVTNSGTGFQGVLTTTPAGSTTTSTGSTTNTQNGTTTVAPSVSGIIPNALNGSTLMPPGNIGVASADILAEQVQLNSQITTFQLLLQGALSDQYLLKNSTAIGERQQTTLGFTVSLDPPHQYKHAVAEVRVIIIPKGGWDNTSIVNLLPSEKTYNVARVTSNQMAFGAGAVIEPISFGVSTGKSKDRLYLAKDTDTLALQFPLPLPPRDRAGEGTLLWKEKFKNIVKSFFELRSIGGCALYKENRSQMEDDVEQAIEAGKQPITFGWQFRPVLGADYVQGGERQVFAQLALGTGLGENYVPEVYVETLWREYDSKNQVVGAVFSDTCNLATQPGGVSVLNKLNVRDVKMTDLGSGQLKLTARGGPFSRGMSALSGQNTLPSVFFDGNTMEVFGNAHDLIEGGDLKIVGENGQNLPFSILTNPKKWNSCGISKAVLRAVPRPDGNSQVDLQLTMGRDYQPYGNDTRPNPLVLIGSQVYGLRESPTVKVDTRICDDAPISPICKYRFFAPTTNLRNSQTFLVRDLTWDRMQASGKTEFFPSFTAATALASAPYIVQQPTDRTAAIHKNAAFQVSTNGTPPLSYQWYVDGVPIKNATHSCYLRSAILSDSKAHFAVAVSNSYGTVTSKSAGIKLVGPGAKLVAGSEPAQCPDDATGNKNIATYEISGYDFTNVAPTCDTSTTTFDKPCLNIYVDSDQKPLDNDFMVVSDNLAIVDNVPAGAKLLRFQIYWGVLANVLWPSPLIPDPASEVEWDLTVTKATEETNTAIVVMPAFLYVGDSQTLSFSSPAFSAFSSAPNSIPVTFNGHAYPYPGMYDTKKKVLKVQITTDITKLPGHKEMLVTVPAALGSGTAHPTTLSFDVVKQIIKE
jgi:hypothetical protein